MPDREDDTWRGPNSQHWSQRQRPAPRPKRQPEKKKEPNPPLLVWSTPVANLADELRDEAVTLRKILGSDVREAKLLVNIADRIDTAVRSGEWDTYVRVEDAAAIEGVSRDAIYARIKRKWERAGKAVKRGGTWYVEASVLCGQPARAER